MKYTKYVASAAGLLGLGALLVACSPAEPKLESGYDFATPETQAMQDDDFSNPGFMWVDIGAEEWATVDGEAGKSCESCHGDLSTMKGVTTSYPKYNADDKKMRALQHQINNCRTEQMKAKAWKWESDQMLGMSAIIKNQSKGMPLNVSIKGEAAPFYEKGKEFYFQRRGTLDMACKHCHIDYPGVKIRAEVLSNGLPNGFPTYRLKWQKLGSLHRRFRGCNSNIRAEPYERGSEEYTNLELFLTHRANGVAVESPSVRK
ncbi:MAG: sulfur oxidation c-type cytochrome SoxA [Rhodospirillales bacterium]|nr:sulfur oxidation c-type cytochrome SoxA [Rhodospirillales bacterium]